MAIQVVRLILVVLVGVSLSDGSSRAQELSFDVASVRPNTSGDRSSFITLPPGGGFTATNMPLRTLVRFAFDVQNVAIVGAPEWTAAERFDIVAKAPRAGISTDQVRRMLQRLLVERFSLRAGFERREMPIYSIVLAHADGRVGARLQRSDIDCAQLLNERASGAAPATPTPVTAASGQPRCSMRSTNGSLMVNDQPLSTLTEALTPVVQRTVVDRTGLTGAWSFELRWAPEPPAGTSPSTDSDRPSIYSALPEQLGLRLEAGRGAVDVLVIHAIGRPHPN